MAGTEGTPSPRSWDQREAYKMNNRGQYGHCTHVGADQKMQMAPWWKLAIGATVILGAGFLVTRRMTTTRRPIYETPAPTRELERSALVGVREGVRY
jgi:hypothetical protein